MNKATTLNKEPATLVTLAERESLLRNQPGFSELTMADMATLVALMQEVNLPSGQAIVTEGDIIDSVYILASGSAEVTHEVVVNNKAGTSLLATLHDGDSIGLKGGQFFSQTGLRTATVTATSPCLLLKLELSDLKAFLETRPAIMDNLHTKSAWMLRMQLIKQAAPFAKLNNQQLAGLASNVKEVEFKANEYIFKQGDAAESCYLITSGKIEVSIETEDGKNEVLTELEPYSVLGESAFLKYSKRSATARTLTKSTMLLMDKDVILELASSEVEVPDTLLTIIKGHCRPLRHENVIYQHRTSADGQKITTLKNVDTNSYLQLTEAGWYIWTQMNGNLTIAELSKLFYKEFKQSDPDEVKQIVQQLVDAGFASIDGKDSLADSKKGSDDENRSIFSRLFNFSYFLPNADKKIDFLYKRFGFMFFNIPSLLLQTVLIVAGIYYFCQTFAGLNDKVKAIGNLPLCLLGVVVFSMCYQILGSLLKAFAIKHFDREVPNFGVIWQKVGPVGIVDTSDMWLSSAWPQIAVCLSGIFANLLLASLIAMYSVYTSSENLSIFAWFCALFIYFQTLRSLDPMLNMDGYELLCGITDSPQLRSLAIKWLLRQQAAGKNHRQEIMFWAYALVYFSIVLLMTQWVLSQLIYQLPGLAIMNLYVFVGLIVVFFIEIILSIQNYKTFNAS